MSDKKNQNLNEDLEIIRKSILNSRSRSVHTPVANEVPSIKANKKDFKAENALLATQFEKGYQHLIDQISAKVTDKAFKADMESTPIPIEEFMISSEKLDTMKNRVLAKTQAIIAPPLNTFCNYSADVQLALYVVAKNFLEDALYDKAIAAFTFLMLINPHVQAFWVDLGVAHERNLNIPQAIENLQMALKVSPSDFSPYYGLIRCYETIKDLNTIKALLENQKNNAALKEEVEEALAYLNSK